jgi:4-amino-4-deoxy-L-arabinose transferase-like glycosyltransferase
MIIDFKKREYLFITLILIFALVLRLYQWDKYAYSFYDEGIYAYFGVISSYDPVLSTLYQPPLFFLIEGVLFSLFKTISAFRLFNIFCSIASIFLAYNWIKKDYSVNEGLLVALLLSTTAFHILHSRFLNQDILLFCLGLGALICVQEYEKHRKDWLLILSGIFLGLGFYTKFTFLVFSVIVVFYARYLKNVTIKRLGIIMLSESFLIFMFLLPHIIVWFKAPNSVYSITNFFEQYSLENIGESSITLQTLLFYIGGTFIYLIPIFILFITSLFKKKNFDKKYNFLFLWVAFLIIVLSLSTKAFIRYLLIQNLGLIPFLLITANLLLQLNKKYVLIILFIILSIDFYYYYYFINEPMKISEFKMFFVETKPFLETAQFLNSSINEGDIILTNEPYLFMPLMLPVFTTNFIDHISCPNNNVKYLVLVNSTLAFHEFTYLDKINNERFYHPY